MALLWHKENGAWADRTDALSFKNAGAWGKKPTWYKHDGQWHLLQGQIAPADPDIFGVVCVATGGGSGTWSWCDSNASEITLETSFFDSHPVYSGIVDEVIDGQAMVRIPKFYVKHETITKGAFAGKYVRYISPYPKDGFHIHPAFMHMGQEIECFWIGKYQGSVSGGKLQSISGIKPTVSISLNTGITNANARNVNGNIGFMVCSMYQVFALSMLMLAEYKTTDMQTKVGRGRSSASSIANVDASDVATATWRGVVGLWGNTSYYVQGCKVTNGIYSVWDNKGNQTFIDTNVPVRTASGWVYPVDDSKDSGESYDLGDVFLPSTSFSSSYSSGTFSDGYYGGSGILSLGGRYDGGNNNGAFRSAFNNTGQTTGSSDTSVRLAKV